jgi:DNA-binding XRE family transcriptional regulator
MSTHVGTVIPQWTQGDRLRKARSLTGMTSREFAETRGVSLNTIVAAEVDKRKVRKITLRAWAMATGVSVEWLETGVEPPAGGPRDPGWAPWGSNPQPTDCLSSLLGAA